MMAQASPAMASATILCRISDAAALEEECWQQARAFLSGAPAQAESCHRTSPARAYANCQALLELKAACDSRSLNALVRVMCNYPDDVEVQLFGAVSLATACDDSVSEHQQAIESKALEALLQAMRRHNIPAVQQWIARCFECLPYMLQSLVQILKNNPEDVQLQILGARCTVRIQSAQSHNEAAHAGLSAALIQAMQVHPDVIELQNAAAVALNVNCGGALSDRLPAETARATAKCAMENGAVAALLGAARTHCENPDMQYNCTLAIGSIVRFWAQECSQYTLDIVWLLLRAMKSHHEDFHIRWEVSRCIRELPEAVQMLVVAMQSAPTDSDLQHWSTWCLAKAYSSRFAWRIFAHPVAPVVQSLVQAMQDHPANAQLQLNAAVALGAICAGWDLSAFQRQKEAAVAGALPVVVQARITERYFGLWRRVGQRRNMRVCNSRLEFLLTCLGASARSRPCGATLTMQKCKLQPHEALPEYRWPTFLWLLTCSNHCCTLTEHIAEMAKRRSGPLWLLRWCERAEVPMSRSCASCAKLCRTTLMTLRCSTSLLWESGNLDLVCRRLQKPMPQLLHKWVGRLGRLVLV